MPTLHHLPGLYEPFSALSHLLGAALFTWLGALLLRRGRGDPLRVALLAVYASSCVLLLASSGARRFASTPDVPTIAELGYKDFEASSWIGFLTTANTPKPKIGRAHV